MSAPRQALSEERARPAAFWLAVAGLVVLRLLLGSDLSVQITFAPHDDSLYVARAFHLINGEAYGPYDSRILIKFPGITEWLAATRFLGIPYLVSLNGIFIAAGLYAATGMLRAGAGRLVVLLAFTLYLFNPITLGFEWIRIIREPLASCLLVMMLGSMIHIAVACSRGTRPVRHLVVLAITFGFAVWVREDDRMLWALLALFVGALAWSRFVETANSGRGGGGWAFVVAVGLVPAVTATAHEYSVRMFLERVYGLPIIHEFNEGEFPRLLGAIRSVRSANDNRLVMVTQDALRQLRQEVPELRPVIDRLPQPGRTTFSCRLHGVCSELGNGWMPFFVKDEAYFAGLTPDLPTAQAYFRRVREAIEKACAEDRIRCEAKGNSLVPPMEARWTKAFFAEGWRLAKMTIVPDNNLLTQPPVAYDVPLPVGRMYQVVTMTDYFDTLLQSTYGERPATRGYASPIASWRLWFVEAYRWLGAMLLIASFAALVLRLYFGNLRFGPVTLVGVVFGLYTLVKLAALSYVAVYMGQFTSRMVFSTYGTGVLLALPFIADTIRSMRTSSGR